MDRGSFLRSVVGGVAALIAAPPEPVITGFAEAAFRAGRQVGKTGVTISAADVWVSDFGVVRILPNHFRDGVMDEEAIEAEAKFLFMEGFE